MHANTEDEFASSPRDLASNARQEPGITPRREVLSCRIKGFYPFPQGIQGPFSWLFRDTHQAILVSTTAGDCQLFCDFMTEGGQAHPVWFDEATKWRVFLGQNIRGEVRIRIRPAGGVVPPGSKLERFWVAAAAYDDRMNIYTNNCRIFCARMEREVARLNDQDCHKGDAPGHAGHGRGTQQMAVVQADVRLAFAILKAVALPLLYPASLLWVFWSGLGDLLWGP